MAVLFSLAAFLFFQSLEADFSVAGSALVVAFKMLFQVQTTVNGTVQLKTCQNI